ncbi:hypothetical protein QTP86_013011 [Hemibagrus guttatus]|nr:hypothetical protein QTP86_013011 [Hemibagrus guttatus]
MVLRKITMHKKAVFFPGYIKVMFRKGPLRYLLQEPTEEARLIKDNPIPAGHVGTKAKEDAFRNGDRVLYNQARNTLNKEIRVAKRSYVKKLENQFSSNDPASVWKGLKDITNYKTPSPSTEANQQLAEDLNEFYCRFETAGQTPHDPSEHLSTQPLTPPATPLSPPPAHRIIEDDVRQMFLKQKKRKAPGPDGVTPTCLKTCADQLAFIFSQIFNRSLELCEVPACFKRSTIIPIPKKPKITGLNDYRPVALTSVVMKSFERLVLAYLKNITGPLLDPLQFAYRANRTNGVGLVKGHKFIWKKKKKKRKKKKKKSKKKKKKNLDSTDAGSTAPSVSLLPPSPLQLSEGSASLLCLLSGYSPQGALVSWTVDGSEVKNGILTSVEEEKSGRYSRSSTLTLSKDLWEKGEEFSCAAPDAPNPSPPPKVWSSNGSWGGARNVERPVGEREAGQGTWGKSEKQKQGEWGEARTKARQVGGMRIKARHVGGVRSRSKTNGGSKEPNGKAKGSNAPSTAERRRRTTSTAEQQSRVTTTAEQQGRAMSTDERRLRGDDVHLAGVWNSPRGGRVGARCCRNSPPLTMGGAAPPTEATLWGDAPLRNMGGNVSLFCTFGGGSKLIVNTGPVVNPSVSLLPPSPLQLSEGSASLFCLLSGYSPQGALVSWTVDGSEVKNGVLTSLEQEKSGRYSRSSTLTLSKDLWEKGEEFS